MGGLSAGDELVVSTGIVMAVGGVADEIRGEEVEGEGGPEEPFAASETEVLVLMMMMSLVFGVGVVELHSDIEAPPCPSCGSSGLLLCLLLHFIISTTETWSLEEERQEEEEKVGVICRVR